MNSAAKKELGVGAVRCGPHETKKDNNKGIIMRTAISRTRVTIDFDRDLIKTVDQRCERDVRSRSYIVNQIMRLALAKGKGKSK